MKRPTLLLLVAAAFAQAPAPPAFDAASVKPASPTSRMPHIFQFLPGGRLHVVNTWIKYAIQQAYDLEDYQVVGGPSWLNSGNRYDIEAKAAGDATKDQIRLMLQTLLAERCQLKTHRGTREFAVLNLIVAKGGPHLTPLKPGEQSKCNRDNSEICGLQTMAQLANFLRISDGHPVLDQTGIQGNYDILLNFDAYELSGRPAPPGYDKPPLTAALAEQLGLRMEPAKAQIPVLVIDSIQRPSDN
jgi:uncharacterized protein (TIGR03435 family)